jgi:hypothetical protein
VRIYDQTIGLALLLAPAEVAAPCLQSNVTSNESDSSSLSAGISFLVTLRDAAHALVTVSFNVSSPTPSHR